jgi:hypothetical protein
MRQVGARWGPRPEVGRLAALLRVTGMLVERSRNSASQAPGSIIRLLARKSTGGKDRRRYEETRMP